MTVSEQTESKKVGIKILNRQYQISCPEHAEPDLHEAAEYLSEKMAELQADTRLINAEHLAVMAALNIIHELFALKASKEAYTLDISDKIERLSQKLGRVLAAHDEQPTEII